MPRSDDYDDYESGPARDSVRFPSGVKAAAIIWIAFGTLGLVGQAISFALTAAGGAAQAGPQAPGSNVCGIGCGVLFALVFLMVGIQTVKGTAKSTLGNGIGSLVFGVLYLAAAVVTAVTGASGRLPAGMDTVMFVMSGFFGLLAMALLVAGTLALMGKSQYEEWRAAQGLARPKSRTQEERDYDEDRPRRRPARDDDEDDRPRRPRRDRDDEGDDR
ncbi:MAG TPA: hypothetical protein VKD90_12625 [Gemmataceae bacterium]|nr:hypothetical protein [Gemmataceae bacterium]